MTRCSKKQEKNNMDNELLLFDRIEKIKQIITRFFALHAIGHVFYLQTEQNVAPI